MSATVNQPLPIPDVQNIQAHGAVVDREFSGEINRASAQGAKFALLLAMLEQDVLQRPALLTNDSDAEKSMPGKTISAFSHYPTASLIAEAQHWQEVKFLNETVHQADISQANLWLVMHPQPLSLYNDPKRLDDEVVANCDIHTQQRLKAPAKSNISVDETGLYEILQNMEGQIDTAA